MRINEVAVASGAYNNFDSDTVSCATQPTPYCQARPGKPAEVCGVSQLAAFDLYSVACGDVGVGTPDSGVIGELNQGRIRVFCADDPCIATSTYTIDISWNEVRVASDDANDVDSKRVQMRLKP